LKLKAGKYVEVRFTVANTGDRAGTEIAEVYAGVPASAEEPPKRLVGWKKIKLNPGEKKEVVVEVDPFYLSIFDSAHDAWQLVPGDYSVMVGGSSQNLPLKESVNLK
jgi:beta-glucosidase